MSAGGDAELLLRCAFVRSCQIKICLPVAKSIPMHELMYCFTPRALHAIYMHLCAQPRLPSCAPYAPTHRPGPACAGAMIAILRRIAFLPSQRIPSMLRFEGRLRCTASGGARALHAPFPSNPAKYNRDACIHHGLQACSLSCVERCISSTPQDRGTRGDHRIGLPFLSCRPYPPYPDTCAHPHTVRIEELEGAIASALRVNKLLNAEVETYLSTADRCGRGRLKGAVHMPTFEGRWISSSQPATCLFRQSLAQCPL